MDQSGEGAGGEEPGGPHDEVLGGTGRGREIGDDGDEEGAGEQDWEAQS